MFIFLETTRKTQTGKRKKQKAEKKGKACRTGIPYLCAVTCEFSENRF